MKLTIRVIADSRLWDGGAIIEVPDPLVESFKPLKTCDEAFLSYVTGDTFKESDDFRRTVKLREDAAEYLSKALANYLLSEMKRFDTHNGYMIKRRIVNENLQMG